MPKMPEEVWKPWEIDEQIRRVMKQRSRMYDDAVGTFTLVGSLPIVPKVTITDTFAQGDPCNPHP